MVVAAWVSRRSRNMVWPTTVGCDPQPPVRLSGDEGQRKLIFGGVRDAGPLLRMTSAYQSNGCFL
jgi:hypothetical protein